MHNSSTDSNRVNIFWDKRNWQKAALEMLAKLTSGSRIRENVDAKKARRWICSDEPEIVSFTI